MLTPNPVIKKQLNEAKAELQKLRAEKARLYPPNTDPLGGQDRYPQDYTAEQIEYHNQLDKRIDWLLERIDELQLKLYTKNERA